VGVLEMVTMTVTGSALVWPSVGGGCVMMEVKTAVVGGGGGAVTVLTGVVVGGEGGLLVRDERMADVTEDAMELKTEACEELVGPTEGVVELLADMAIKTTIRQWPNARLAGKGKATGLLGCGRACRYGRQASRPGFSPSRK